MRQLTAVVLLALVLVPLGAQTTWYVDATAPGPGNGSQASPFTRIQFAIDVASSGDSVLVLPGTYYETLMVIGKSLVIRGVEGAQITTIDALQMASVVTFYDVPGQDARFEGFTVTGGRGVDGTDGPLNQFLGGSSPYLIYPTDGAAGGINCGLSDVTISDCVITGNWGGEGGDGGSHTGMGPYPFGHEGAVGGPGGILVWHADARLVRSIVAGNTGGRGGNGGSPWGCIEGCSGGDGGPGGPGGVRFVGGGVAEGCRLEANQGGSGGAGSPGYVSHDSSYGGLGGPGGVTGGIIANCVTTLNQGGLGGDGSVVIYPGYLYSVDGGQGGAGGISDALVVNGTILLNTGGQGGPGGNSGVLAATGPGGIDGDAVNTILWGNVPSQAALGSTITHCDVQGGFSGAGNIDADPLWVDAANGDYHLLPTSPCIDAGDNAAASLPVTDFEGDPRIFHDTVDMGADETILTQVFQQLAPSEPVTVINYNLTPGSEYFNLISIEPCPAGPGEGYPGLGGLWVSTSANAQAIASQLLLPLGTEPFHFLAAAATMTFGPYVASPVTLESLCFEFTGGAIGPASRVVRFEIQ